MKDDILDRFGKAMAVVIGGFLFLYLMIVATQSHPAGISLLIVRTTETIAKWFIYLTLTGAVVILLLSVISFLKRRKRLEEELREKLIKEQKEKLISLERERKQLEEENKLKERREFEFILTRQKEEERLLNVETHLKTRSAEEAVNDALKHFM